MAGYPGSSGAEGIEIIARSSPGAVTAQAGVQVPALRLSGGAVAARYSRSAVSTGCGLPPRQMLTAGTLRACWLGGLAFVRPGAAALVLVIAVQFGLVTYIGVFNPVFATYRLEQTAADRVARTLSAWSVTSNATIAALTALWGLLASLTGLRTAIALAGLLMLATPLLLPRRAYSETTGSRPAAARLSTCLRNRSVAGSRRRSADQVRKISRTAPSSRISR
jgi:hypothetical protein